MHKISHCKIPNKFFLNNLVWTQKYVACYLAVHTCLPRIFQTCSPMSPVPTDPLPCFPPLHFLCSDIFDSRIFSRSSWVRGSWSPCHQTKARNMQISGRWWVQTMGRNLRNTDYMLRSIRGPRIFVSSRGYSLFWGYNANKCKKNCRFIKMCKAHNWHI